MLNVQFAGHHSLNIAHGKAAESQKIGPLTPRVVASPMKRAGMPSQKSRMMPQPEPLCFEDLFGALNLMLLNRGIQLPGLASKGTFDFKRLSPQAKQFVKQSIPLYISLRRMQESQITYGSAVQEFNQIFGTQVNLNSVYGWVTPPQKRKPEA